jgi:predicted ABC-type ATPase
MKVKNAYIISGSNGSGKTTFARKFLPNYAKCPNFVNADLIAQGLSPFSPRRSAMKAGRLVLEQIKQLAEKNVDFGFETTLSGKAYLKTFRWLKEKGYKLHLFFLWIPGSQLAIERIKIEFWKEATTFQLKMCGAASNAQFTTSLIYMNLC